MLAPWKKIYDQPGQRIEKQRLYFANKGPPSQSYGFSTCHVWMWGLDYNESWVPKNWCFWTVVLKKALESPLDCKEIHQSILKEISSEYSLEGLMLKLKLQYFGHLIWRIKHLKRRWCWETLNAGGEGDDRGWDDWMASLTSWTWVWASSRSWWRTGKPGILQSMGSQRVGHDWITEVNHPTHTTKKEEHFFWFLILRQWKAKKKNVGNISALCWWAGLGGKEAIFLQCSGVKVTKSNIKRKKWHQQDVSIALWFEHTFWVTGEENHHLFTAWLHQARYFYFHTIDNAFSYPNITGCHYMPCIGLDTGNAQSNPAVAS